ncbi:MAG: D-alanyl-D-alanine carboxypeptidase [Ruminococcaceae bacterium]|nr:D-alanyl-D-alanine carboxypeptidase [Oscillospiraceae bacterium]
MKKIRAFCLFLAAALTVLLLSPGVAAQDIPTADQSVLSGCHSVDAAMQLNEQGKLTETAKAAIVYERNSDTMIYAHNPDQRIYPTSMVKLMTALVAIEKGDPQAKVKVTKRAISDLPLGAAVVKPKLEPGEELTLEDLLYCLVAASANDAAMVIAEYIAGSQDAFLTMMNQKAQELGCKDTVFTNPHGLHDPNMYTTARDLCRITDAALDNELFKALFCADSHVIPATNKCEERTVYTGNHMISKAEIKKYYDPRVTGGKTGTVDGGGRCLIATSEQGGMELLTVVMDAKPTYEPNGLALATFGSFEETTVLMNHVFANYTCRQIFYEGQIVSQYPVSGGANSAVTIPARGASTVLPVGVEKDQLNWVYTNYATTLTAPVEKGQRISVLQVWYGSKCVAQTDLVAVNAVKAQTEYIQTERSDGENAGKVWLIVAIVLVAVVVLVGGSIVALRWTRRFRLNARRRSRRADRRRSR